MEPRDQSPPDVVIDQDRPRQFSLRQLLLWVAIVALMCAPLAYIGTLPGVVVTTLLGLSLIICLRLVRKATVVEVFVMAGVLCVLVAVFLPPMVPAKQAALRFQCSNNLKQIVLALRLYHNEHDCFPPAYIPDEHGKPMHSWRVLILPYIEQGNLYKQYSFDEPWDGPNNSLLYNQMPQVYQCPCMYRGPPSAKFDTSYLAIVGTNTAWPSAESRTLREIARKDGTTNTILVAEVANPGIHWMEPRDLDWESTSTLINQGPPGRCISSDHAGGANVAMADGSVRFISNDTPGHTVSALMTADGGEPVDLDDY